jgi:hypothetical protein
MWSKKNTKAVQKLFNGTQQVVTINFGSSNRKATVAIEFVVGMILLYKLGMMGNGYTCIKEKSMFGKFRDLCPKFEDWHYLYILFFGYILLIK